MGLELRDPDAFHGFYERHALRLRSWLRRETESIEVANDLTAESFAEKARIKLPAAFKIDEIPDAFRLETAFGTYNGKCVPKGGELECTRSLEIKTQTVPPDQYNQVREFFSKIAGYEQSPVVLAR